MKILIIGYGSIGKRHADILKYQLNAGEVELVTSRNIDDYKTYKSIDEINNLREFDYFIISNETYMHYDCLKFLENKVNDKKILVEKPLFYKNEELNICNNKVIVGYNLRFHPVIQNIKRELKQEVPVYANIIAGSYLPQWRPGSDYRQSYSAIKEKGGGVLLDLSHEIDYLQWLFGKISDLSSINQKCSKLEINTDDIASVIGFTEKRVIFNFSVDYISKIKIRQILVHTGNKTILGDLISNTLIVSNSNGETEKIITPDIERNYTYTQMHSAFMRDDYSCLCTYTQAKDVMQVIDLIRKKSM